MEKKKLIISKEVISSLDDTNLSNLKGGQTEVRVPLEDIQWSGGCTDGCTGSVFLCTYWNCTKADCTADCGTNACDTNAFCTC
jgi:hypothetical protein